MRRITLYILCAMITFALATPALAHGGRTDSSGGHTDHSTGDYHYHHGYPAHDHWDIDGDGDLDCPYKFKENTGENRYGSSSKDTNHTDSSSNKISSSKESKAARMARKMVSAVESVAILEIETKESNEDKSKGWNGVLMAILEFLAIIAIVYAFYGIMYIGFRIKDAISQRRYRKGKETNYSALIILLSIFFIVSSVVIIILFSSEGPGFEESPIAANDFATMFKSFGMIAFLWLITISVVAGLIGKIPEDKKPPLAIYNCLIASTIISALIWYVSYIFGFIA